jgi:hypothetical protein
MKQTYIAPVAEVIEIEIEGQLMALSADKDLPGSGWGGQAGNNTGNGPMDADAPGRRGEWGNLWADRY